jgi:hypothetical protein
MRKAISMWLLVLAWSVATAQSRDLTAVPFFQLLGRITDSAGGPLASATVQFTTAKDTITTLTGGNGDFIFHRLVTRAFQLKLTMKGYLPYSHAYTVANDRHSVQLQTITLQINFNELDPVTVTWIKPINIGEDTVSYNVAAFPVRDGSDVEDILKRLPGVEVDINGNVIVQGKQLAKVLVNGKEFFGSDVLLAIQNLPADAVDKLQVIDDYGDKARLTGVKSGESTKVLNIILKPDKRNGEFGRLDAAGGDQGKYEAGGFVNTFKGERQFSANGSISNNNPAGSDFVKRGGFNYSDQWDPCWSGALNLNSAIMSPHTASSKTSASYYPGEQLQQTENSRSNSHDDNNNLNTRLTFKPDSYSTLRLTTMGSVSQSHDQVTGNFTTIQLDSGYNKSITGQSLNNSQSSNQNLNSILYYENLSPHSRRRFTFQADAGYSGANQSGNTQYTAAILTDSVASNSLLHYVMGNQSHSWNFNLNSNYFLPLGRTSFLEMGSRFQSSASVNDILTRQPDSVTGILQTIDSLSSNIVLRTMTQNIHAGYTGKLRQLDLTASVDAEPGQQRGTADSKGDVIAYHYFSLLPNVQADWNFDKSQKLNISYSGQPNLPGLQELAPFTNVSNPQYPVTGNPDLKPSYTNNISLHYERSSLRSTQFYGFGIGLNYSSVQHTIIQNLTSPTDGSQVVQATTYLNAGSTNTLNVDFHLTLPAFFNKRLRINYSGKLGESQTITMTGLPFCFIGVQ